jgi:hypothetical protein
LHQAGVNWFKLLSQVAAFSRKHPATRTYVGCCLTMSKLKAKASGSRNTSVGEDNAVEVGSHPTELEVSYIRDGTAYAAIEVVQFTYGYGAIGGGIGYKRLVEFVAYCRECAPYYRFLHEDTLGSTIATTSRWGDRLDEYDYTDYGVPIHAPVALDGRWITDIGPHSSHPDVSVVTLACNVLEPNELLGCELRVVDPRIVEELIMPNLSTAATKSIRALIDDLVERNFAAIEADGRVGRLTVEELRIAIDAYGKTLVVMPRNGLESVDAYPSDEDPEVIAVDVPLWTREEGRSDLTLSLTIVERAGSAIVSIDDLHVL